MVYKVLQQSKLLDRYIFRNKNIYFSIALILWLSMRVINNSFLASKFSDNYTIVCRLAVFYLCFINELSKNFIDKYFVVFLILISIGICSGIYSDNFLLVDIIILVYCSRCYSIKSVIKIYFVTVLIACILIVLLSQFNIITDYVWSTPTRSRHGFGFTYTTYLSHYILALTMSFFLLVKRDHLLLAVISFFCVNYITYIFTDSRNSFILTNFILICLFVSNLKRAKGLNNILYNRFLNIMLCILSFVFIPLLSFCLPLFYNSSNIIFQKVNSILSNRLEQTQIALSNYNTTVFGQRTYWTGNSLDKNGLAKTEQIGIIADRNFVDNSFVNIYISHGIVPLFFILFTFVLIAYYAIISNCTLLNFFVFITFLHSFLDPQLIQLDFSPIIFYVIAFFAYLKTKDNGVQYE